MPRHMVASDWKPLYAAAMLESGPKQLRHSIDRTIAAMRARLKELEAISPSTFTLEASEVHSALSYLYTVAACLASFQRLRGSKCAPSRL
jgi:hypothetical protein